MTMSKKEIEKGFTLLKQSGMYDYLTKKRCISEATIISQLGTTLFPEKFPCRNKEGKVFKRSDACAFQTCELPETLNQKKGKLLGRQYRLKKIWNGKKIMYEKGKSQGYLYDELDLKDDIWVTEGDPDYLTAKEYGLNCISIGGVGRLRGFAEELKRLGFKKNLIILVDNDPSGDESTFLLMQEIKDGKINYPIYDARGLLGEHKDINDLHQSLQGKIQENLISKGILITNEFIEEKTKSLSPDQKVNSQIDLKLEDFCFSDIIKETYQSIEARKLITDYINSQIHYGNVLMIPIELQYNIGSKGEYDQLDGNVIKCILSFTNDNSYKLVHLKKTDRRRTDKYREFLDNYAEYEFKKIEKEKPFEEHWGLLCDIIRNLAQKKFLKPVSYYNTFGFIKDKETKEIRFSNGTLNTTSGKFIHQVNKSLDKTEKGIFLNEESFEIDSKEEAIKLFQRGLENYFNDKELALPYSGFLISGIFKKELFDERGNYFSLTTIGSSGSGKSPFLKRLNMVVGNSYRLDSLNGSTGAPLEIKLNNTNRYIGIDEITRGKDEKIQSLFESLVLSNYDQEERSKCYQSREGLKKTVFENKSSLILTGEGTFGRNVDTATLGRTIIIELEPFDSKKGGSIKKSDIDERMKLGSQTSKGFFWFLINKHTINFQEHYEVCKQIMEGIGLIQTDRSFGKVLQLLFGHCVLNDNITELENIAKQLKKLVLKGDEKAKSNTDSPEKIVETIISHISKFCDFKELTENNTLPIMWVSDKGLHYKPSRLALEYIKITGSNQSDSIIMGLIKKAFDPDKLSRGISIYGSTSRKTKYDVCYKETMVDNAKAIHNAILSYSKDFEKIHIGISKNDKLRGLYDDKEIYLKEVISYRHINLAEVKQRNGENNF